MKKFILRNYKNEVIKVNIDLKYIKYIFKLNVTGDEVLFTVDNNNFVTYYDSSNRPRVFNYFEGFCLLHPSFIEFGGFQRGN